MSSSTANTSRGIMGWAEQENEILREALEGAKKKLQEQDEVLQQLLSQATVRGVIVSVQGSRVLVSCPMGVIEVEYPEKAIRDRQLASLIKNGAGVRMIQKPEPAIVDVISLGDGFGDLAVVSKEGQNGECHVEWQGNTRIVRYGSAIKSPEVGDRLMMDALGIIAMRNIGPDETKFSFQGASKVSWQDIGGLVEAKETLIEVIENPRKYPELYKAYQKKQTKGVLLYGPPGCGKTMLGKAVAFSLAAAYGKEAVGSGFIYVKGPEILDKYVGNSEAMIRGLFARARKHQKKHGYPAVLFIDEGDAILGKRDGRPGMGIEATTVPQFLSEMDGLDEDGPIVIIATNRPDSLDSAVTRDGRVDRKIRITRPDRNGAVDIFKLYLKGTPLDGMDAHEAANYAATLLYDHKFRYYDLFGTDGTTTHFTLAGLVNGAMIAGVVDKATSRSMRRDLQNNGSISGVCLEDLRQAIESVYVENKHLNHEKEVQEYVEDSGLKVNDIIKAESV